MALSLVPTAAFGQSARTEQIRVAASRAVATLQASQARWYDKRLCSSCHHQYQPAIAFAVARKHGVLLDESVAAADAAKAFDFSDVDGSIQFTNAIEPALGEAYRMVAAHAADVTPNFGTAMTARFLIARQRPAGDWSGLNQRPPSSSSDFAKTALALRAVQLFHHRADAQAAQMTLARATQWLASHAPQGVEDRTYQLLGLAWAGADRRLLDRLTRELLATQQADGGWASITGRSSEAYSTAEALVALHDAGSLDVSHSGWKRGIDFLVRTQAEDGSWHVPSRLHAPARMSPPYFESGYPYGHDQYISAAGAAWSIMALAEALPKAATSARPKRRQEARPLSEPWIETVVFGTVGDLHNLLDRGFNPNASTDSGKTTALMMAAFDPEKLRLLLDRGADVNARASSGFTALMVATQYGESDVAVNLLLDRGARGRLTGDTSSIYGLALASHAGNATTLERLQRSGDPVNARFRVPLSGVVQTPLALAIRHGDSEIVRKLLDLGAEIEGADSEPWSSLEYAVLNNRLDVARLLLERGADINYVDKAGYTPLLLAASIDFGDTAMIDLLLQAGARVDAKSPAGKTALDLAREYRHAGFVTRLERASGPSVQDR
jgi:ankyrin repeat protein